MSGRTHAIVGANAVWLSAIVEAGDSTALFMIAAGVVGGLLPDVDASYAKIHTVAGGIFGPFRGVFRHRHFFHSILATILITIISSIFFNTSSPLLAAALALGYASHLILDGFNHAGTRYLFPLRRMFHLVPRPLRSRVGGLMDHLFLIAGCTGVIIFFLTFQGVPATIAIPPTLGN